MSRKVPASWARSSPDRVEAFFNAIFAVFGEAEFRAAAVLRACAGGAGKERAGKALKKALSACCGARPTPQRVGRWLQRHDGVEAAGVKLVGDFEERKRSWTWAFERPESEADPLADPVAIVAAVSEAACAERDVKQAK